jgi:hypothetical protein
VLRFAPLTLRSLLPLRLCEKPVSADAGAHPLASADGNAGGRVTDRATGAVPLWHAQGGRGTGCEWPGGGSEPLVGSAWGRTYAKGRSFGSGSRAALASGKRLREKNLSFAQTSSRKSWRVPHPQRRSGFGAVLSALGCPVCPWVTTGFARWVLGLTPHIEPTRTCRTDRAGSVSAQHRLPKGEERVGLLPSPDLWAGRITYMVRFVKMDWDSVSRWAYGTEGMRPLLVILLRSYALSQPLRCSRRGHSFAKNALNPSTP